MHNRTERELYEREQRREVEISRNRANANNALLAGVFVATIAALGVVFFALSQQNRTQAPTNESPDINITVPEQQVPQVQPPEVDIDLPEPNLPQVQPPEVNIQPPDVNVPDVDVNVPTLEVPTVETGEPQQPATQTEPPQQ